MKLNLIASESTRVIHKRFSLSRGLIIKRPNDVAANDELKLLSNVCHLLLLCFWCFFPLYSYASLVARSLFLSRASPLVRSNLYFV
jgi:hypothetical protein